MPDIDLTTDAVPEQVLEIIRRWRTSLDGGHQARHDRLRRRDEIFEITTYRSESYQPRSRKPDIRYGTSLVADLGAAGLTINAMAARLPSFELVDPSAGSPRWPSG